VIYRKVAMHSDAAEIGAARKIWSGGSETVRIFNGLIK
jgi:hypothetical protein